MNSAYALIPISLLVVFFYAISFFISRLEIYSKTTHRKIWNFILLLTFLTTGLIGLLLVIKINYKFTIPFYENLLKYHVEFGIGMALVAVFHLSWHLKYYLKIFKKNKFSENEYIIQECYTPFNPSLIKWFAFLSGIISITTQIILIREFLTVFNGNELVIGIILANWMILTAIGSYLGKFVKAKFVNLSYYILFLILLSIFPIIAIFLINYLKNLLFIVGAMLSIYEIIAYSFLLLIPFCLTSGLTFTILSNYYSTIKNKNYIGNIYAIESTGSVVGGLILSFLLIYLFSGIKSLLILCALILLTVISVAIPIKQYKYIIVSFILLCLYTFLFVFKTENIIRQPLFKNQMVIDTKDTPYGNIVLTEKTGLMNIYINGNLLFNTEDVIRNEESVHYAMLQLNYPKNILLVSGGLSGQIKEILKYNVQRIDYIEPNHWLLDFLSPKTPELTNNKVNTIINDPIKFLKKTSKKYDAIIINVPEPSTLELNRYYTIEFFKLIKNVLTPNGVLTFSLLSSSNYMNDEALKINSSVYNTLSYVFENILIIPGEKNYYISSDRLLQYNISDLVIQKEINNEYVNQYYIDNNLLKNRSEIIHYNLKKNVNINQDFKPVIYLQHIKYWLKYFPGKFWTLGIILLLFCIIIIWKSNIYTMSMFTAGFTASAIEIILLFGLQILFGNIYLFTAFVFTFFMIGLSIGSNYSGRIFKSVNIGSLQIIQLILAILAILSIASIFILHKVTVNNYIIYSILVFLVLLTGIVTGNVFSIVTKLMNGTYSTISAGTYSYDLYGSAIGALVISVYLIPSIGIINSGIAVGILNIFMVLILFSKTLL